MPRKQSSAVRLASAQHPLLAYSAIVAAAAAVREAGPSFIELKERLHPIARLPFAVAVGEATRWPNLTMVADGIDLSPRHLQRLFALARLPAPLALIVNARWLPMAYGAARGLFKDSAELAVGFGFPSPKELGRAARRQLGKSVVELWYPYALTDITTTLLAMYGASQASRNLAPDSRDLAVAQPIERSNVSEVAVIGDRPA